MKTILLIFSMIISGGIMNNSHAQISGIKVKGRVIDKHSNGVPGITITIKGTSTGTISDGNGKFSVQVPDTNSTLVFYYMGYATEEIQSKSLAEEIQFKSPVEEIQIGKKSTLNLLLDSDGINFVFWCCTDHKPPDGPHCSIDKEELKKVTKCNHFKIAN